jgi:hypothetical protein
MNKNLAYFLVALAAVFSLTIALVLFFFSIAVLFEVFGIWALLLAIALICSWGFYYLLKYDADFEELRDKLDRLLKK